MAPNEHICKPNNRGNCMYCAVKIKKCVSDGKTYIARQPDGPAQLLCSTCHQFWFAADPVPECKEIQMVGLQEVTEPETEKPQDINGHAIDNNGKLIFDPECHGCDAPTTPEGWEIDFEDNYSDIFYTRPVTGYECSENKQKIKDFIRSILSTAVAEERERINKIIDVPKDEIVNVMELAIRNKILSTLKGENHEKNKNNI